MAIFKYFPIECQSAGCLFDVPSLFIAELCNVDAFSIGETGCVLVLCFVVVQGFLCVLSPYFLYSFTFYHNCLMLSVPEFAPIKGCILNQI